jgi:predicted MPP superfamily phosphohydrolase
VSSIVTRLGRGLLWTAATLGIWLYASNHWLLHWANPTLKSACMAALGASLVLGGIVAALRAKNSKWLTVPATVVLCFCVAETRRAWLRHRYAGHAEVVSIPPATQWWHPITTTDLVVTHLRVSSNLPVARLRVVHLTDLHFTTSLPTQYYESLRSSVEAQHPDLVLLTGDYISRPQHLEVLRSWLEIPLKARYGVYATLGNHEAWIHVEPEVRELLRNAGYEVISGRCVAGLEVSTGTVTLCGTEVPWGPEFSLPARDPENFVIALSHTADNIYALSGRVDAVFSGHYHGGQFRLPGLGALVVPSRYGRRFDRGQFDVEGTLLFVSAGLGADYPPIRIYCPPELLVVDFVRR